MEYIICFTLLVAIIIIAIKSGVTPPAIRADNIILKFTPVPERNRAISYKVKNNRPNSTWTVIHID